MAQTFKACDCDRCRSLCHNPGWFTPEEARAAIAAGLAPKLMVDYFVGNPNIYVLCPASRGCEGDRAPNSDELGGFAVLFMRFAAKGQCTLQEADGRCSIHGSDFKPSQCRAAMACEDDAGIDNEQAMKPWDNPEAQALVREWMKIVSLDESELGGCY